MRESSASLFLWRPWPASLLVRRIQAVEPASQGRPFDPADRAVALLGVVEAVALDGGALHLLRDRIERRAGLLDRELHVAGALGAVHPHEGLADRAADGQQAVVAHDEHAVVAEIGDQALDRKGTRLNSRH